MFVVSSNLLDITYVSTEALLYFVMWKKATICETSGSLAAELGTNLLHVI